MKESLIDHEATSSTEESSPLSEDGEPPVKKDLPMLKVFLLVNLFQVFYTILLSLVKDMTTKRNVGVFEFAFFRSLINMFMSAQIVRQYNLSFYDCVPVNERGIMFWRSVIGTLGFLTYTTAPMYIPIGVFQIIVNLALFAVAFIAWAWLGEQLTLIEVGAMFVAFYGIYLIQQTPKDESSELAGNPDASSFGLGIALAIFTFIAMAWLSVCNRRMKGVNFAVLQFNQALVSTVIAGSIMIALCINAKTMPFNYDSWWTYAEMLAAAFANFFGQTLFVIAEQNANPALVQLLAYVGVFYMFGSDYFFFHQTISPIQ